VGVIYSPPTNSGPKEQEDTSSGQSSRRRTMYSTILTIVVVVDTLAIAVLAVWWFWLRKPNPSVFTAKLPEQGEIHLRVPGVREWGDAPEELTIEKSEKYPDEVIVRQEPNSGSEKVKIGFYKRRDRPRTLLATLIMEQYKVKQEIQVDDYIVLKEENGYQGEITWPVPVEPEISCQDWVKCEPKPVGDKWVIEVQSKGNFQELEVGSVKLKVTVKRDQR
jgi:hypothetical protein